LAGAGCGAARVGIGKEGDGQRRHMRALIGFPIITLTAMAGTRLQKAIGIDLFEIRRRSGDGAKETLHRPHPVLH
jgi:hypothetical protein